MPPFAGSIWNAEYEKFCADRDMTPGSPDSLNSWLWWKAVA